MSTPRTDALAKREFVPDGVWIKHARELERENAALRAWIREEGLRNNLCTYYVLDREICTNCECGRAARKEGGAS